MVLSGTEQRIVIAATETFVRFGPRKTSMNDIASAASVSRQTLYDLFGGKDNLITASIRYNTDLHLTAVRSRLDDALSLEGKLDVYFAETARKSFAMLKSAGDPEDLLSGYNSAGDQAIKRSHLAHEKLIAEILAPYEAKLARHGLTVQELSHFFVTATTRIKTSAADEDDLDCLIRALKAGVLAMMLP